jgi:hypothetical protein
MGYPSVLDGYRVFEEGRLIDDTTPRLSTRDQQPHRYAKTLPAARHPPQDNPYQLHVAI